MVYPCCDGPISEVVVVHLKISLVSMVLSGMAAAAGPLRVSADGEPLASPIQQPTQRATAPVISGVDPEIYLSEGEQGDITPSDIPVSRAIQTPGLICLPVTNDFQAPLLNVPLQKQQGEVSCSLVSLAMDLT
jgi:hypothetical protein